MPLFIISQSDFDNLQRKATGSGLALKPLWQDGTRTGLSFWGVARGFSDEYGFA